MKNLKVFGTIEVPDKIEDVKEVEKEGKKDAKFLRDMGKKAYFDSDMKLEERLNRTAHYRDRDSTRD
jgi:hypothetical protein